MAVGDRLSLREVVSSDEISPSKNSGSLSVALLISNFSMAPDELNMSSRPIGANEMLDVISCNTETHVIK